MGNYTSKYSLNEDVKYIIQNTIFIGKISSVIFTEHGTFYNITVSGDIYKIIAEDAIEK